MTEQNNSEEIKQTNAKSGQNLLNDSFFNSVDDGLEKLDFTKLGGQATGAVAKAAEKPKEQKPKLKTKALPAVEINKKKERDMTKKQLESMGFSTDDPSNTEQMKQIWQEMSTVSTSDFKLMVLRLEPQMVKGTKINGYLETFHLPTTIPDIIEQIGQKYGGGKYQIKIVDGMGKYVKSKTFEIAGLPKIPSPDTTKAEAVTADATAATTTTPTTTDTTATTTTSTTTTSDDDDDDDYFDYAPRRRLRPLRSGFDGGAGGAGYSPYNQSPYYSQTYDPYRSNKRDSLSKDDLEDFGRKVEDTIADKFDSKLDNLATIFAANNNKSESFLNADVVKAFAPVVVAWMDSKSNKDNQQAGQFSEMNKQVVSLMQGMQDLVRIGDKSREDFSEKERNEREKSRRETLEYQQKMEERFLTQQRMAEERHQQMMMQMRQGLESKHSSQYETEQKMRLEYEKMREEFRQREEIARRESREREDRLREELRIRDEETRRRETEQQQRMLAEERKWREEMRMREEESRRREAEWKEEIRQKEINALNDVKLKELEIMRQVREMDSQKTDMQHKLLEQIYQNNLGSRESQLHMELAIAKLTSDNESKMLQANAQMELEKIRHATQMQMSKMKNEMATIEGKKEDDPFAASMNKYLQRKLQIDMIKELNMEVDEDDVPGGSLMGMLTNLLKEGAGPILQTLLSGGRGPAMPAPQGRVVNPSPPPIKPRKPRQVEPQVEDDEEDFDDTESHYANVEDSADDDLVEDLEDEVEETPEDQGAQDMSEEFYGIDPMQEIPKVGAYFEYLKGAIEGGETTHKEAAEAAEQILSPPIVSFLKQVPAAGGDSSLVINQLYPLLSSMYTEDFVMFFTQESTIVWMNEMLRILAGGEPQEEVVEEPKEEPKAEEPKETKAEEEPSEEKSEEAAAPKPKRKRKPRTSRKKKVTTTKEG